jgi:hypothetical protein
MAATSSADSVHSSSKTVGNARAFPSSMISAKHLRLTGTVLLVAGLLAAAIIYCTARLDETLGILGVDIPTKREALQLERMGGKSYILFNDINEWFTNLWRGRELAYTIGVLAIAGFLSFRWMADLLDYSPPSDEPVQDAENQDGA